MAATDRRKLSDAEVSEGLARLPGWVLEGGQIAKQYTFSSYKEGLVFASVVGYLADRMDHHPDLFIGYKKVRVALNTHDVDGISPLDFALAEAIEGLA
jgi:4a-hydroxytetrahydrobiopterin dehydratase